MSLTSSEILTLGLSTLSLIVAALAAYKAYSVSAYQLRVVNRLEYQKLLFEIDKELMRDPDLWMMYDSHPLATETRKDDPLVKSKREAFLYFHANLLELVYVFFSDAKWLSADERFVAKSWDNWPKQLIANSSELRALLSRKDLEESYN